MDEKTLEATRLWTLALPTVSAFVASLVRDFQSRDDVLQDVAVAILDSFDSYDPARPFLGWALGVARNQVRLHFRRRSHERIVFDSEAVDSLAFAFATVAVEEVRALDHLGDCIRQLDARSRQLCRLRYEQDLKPASIGQTLGMGANAVAKALQRMRERLKECIERKASAREGGS